MRRRYDVAPAAPPAQLPYFVYPDDTVATGENELALRLATEGATATLAPNDECNVRAAELLAHDSPAVAKAVKAALKAKTPEARSCRSRLGQALVSAGCALAPVHRPLGSLCPSRPPLFGLSPRCARAFCRARCCVHESDIRSNGMHGKLPSLIWAPAFVGPRTFAAPFSTPAASARLSQLRRARAWASEAWCFFSQSVACCSAADRARWRCSPDLHLLVPLTWSLHTPKTLT